MRGHVEGGTGILPVESCGIGILPMSLFRIYLEE